MSFLYQSLSGLETIESVQLASNQRITLLTSGGMVNVTWGTLFNTITDPLEARIATLEAGGGTGQEGVPSIWPTPRTLSLTGAITGSVAMDGSQNVSLATLIADGSLTLAKVSTLSTRLNTLDTAVAKVWGTGVSTGPNPTSYGGDLNLLSGATFVFTQSGVTTNVPVAGGDPFLILQNGPINSGGQFALRNGEAWLRGQTSGSWGFWNKLWTSSNLNPNDLLLKTDIAQAATKLSTARNFSLTGVITSAGLSFDGTQNIALSTAIADNALSIAKTSGLQSALNARMELRGSIAAATSLNSVIASGAYYQTTPSEATVINKYPVAGAVGVLIVWTQGAYVVQEYTLLPNTTYRRVYDGIGWSTWSKPLTSAEFDPNTKYDKTGGVIGGDVTLSGSYKLLVGGSAQATHFNSVRAPGPTTDWAFGIYKATPLDAANLRGGLWQGATSVSLVNATNAVWHELKITDDGFLKFNDNTVYHGGNFSPANPVPTGGMLHVGDPSGSHLRFRNDGRYTVNGGATWREINETPQAVTDPRYSTVKIGPDDDLMLYESSPNSLGVRTGDSTDYRYFVFANNGNFEVQNGRILIGGSEAWHAGNFDPTTKLSVSGNAASATKLVTPRLINGVSFDGTVNITVPAIIGISTINDLSVRVASGFYERSSPDVGTGFPEEGGAAWWHVQTQTHSNTSNNHSYQRVIAFADVGKTYVRETNNNGLALWYLDWNAKNLPNPLSRDGGTMLGALTSHALGFNTPTADGPLLTKAANAFTSGTYNSLGRWGLFKEATGLGIGLPAVTATANSAKIFMYNADSTVSVAHTIWSSGNLTPFDVTIGANVRGTTNHFVGASGQQIVRGIGWSNDVVRWREVLEADASYALYAYDAAGAMDRRVLNIETVAAGGESAVTMAVDNLYVTGATSRLYMGTSNHYFYMNSTHVGLNHTVDGIAWRWDIANRHLYTAGAVSGTRLFAGWDSGFVGAVSSNNWFRASGATGVMFSDYGGGLYMTDANAVRTYNGKGMIANYFETAAGQAVWHAGTFDPATKQDALGYTPVQQGGGVGQGTNKVYLGWSGSALKLQVDSSDQGFFVMGGRTVTAGNGLTGGGDLNANRTFTLGTPGTLSGSTTNAVTATSHTHALSTNLSAWDVITPSSKAEASRPIFQGFQTTGIATATGSLGGLEVQSANSTSAAFMSFHRPGNYAAYFGLDTDNNWKVGGWSAGAVAYTLYHTGNFNPATKLDTGATAANSSLLNGRAYSDSSTGSTIVGRNSSGDIQARLFRSEYATTNASVNFIMTQVNQTTDNYMRPSTPAQVMLDLAASGGAAFAGVVSGTRIVSGFDSAVANSINCSGWFRSNGNSGWFSETWGGGVYMTDATYVRTYASKAMAAADFVISSDKRLKTEIAPLKFNGRLRPVHFRWIETGVLDFGFIANDVARSYPEAVGWIAGDVEKGQPKMIRQLSYQKLTAVISHQVNELEDDFVKLHKKVDKLVKQNTKLKSEVKSLSSRLARLEKQFEQLLNK